MSVIATDSIVNDSQLNQFQSDGFVRIRGLISRDEAVAIRDTFMTANEGGPVEGLSDVKRDANGQSMFSTADPLSFYPRMMNPHRHTDKAVGRLAMRYMLDSRFQAVLSTLMGEEPYAVQTMFYFKPPGARGQAFHQDNFYLKVKPGTCTAAWIAVDDCDSDNGGMMCVPETGRLEVQCPGEANAAESFTRELVAIPEGKSAVLPKMAPGDVLFFNGSTIHGSGPNQTTDRFRRSLICHYVPRSTVELSHWYTAYDFDGEKVNDIRINEDGGPCGNVDSGAH